MLDLYKLTLDGFLSYDHVEIPLDQEGITAIRGQTGAGKSAIIEAIIYLLFGETLRKKGSVNNLINQVLNNGYEIQLDFAVDGKAMSIKEIRGRENDDLLFTIDGEDKRGKTSPETRKNILAALGRSSDDFMNSSVLGQRIQQLLIDGTSGERADSTVQIFGLEKYDNYIDKCDDDVKEAIRNQKDISAKLVQYKADLESLQHSLLDKKEAEEFDESALETIKSKIKESEEKLNKIREMASDAKTAIGKAKTVEASIEKMKSLNEELSLLEKELQELGTEFNPDAGKKLKEEINKQAEISAQVRQCNNGLSDIETLGEKCPITKEPCPVNVPKEYKGNRIKELTGSLENNQKELKKIQKSVSELEEEKKRYEKRGELNLSIGDRCSLIESFGELKIADTSEEEKRLQKCQEGIEKGIKHINELQEKKSSLLSQKALIKQRKEFEERVRLTLTEKKALIEKTEKDMEEQSIELQYLSSALAVFKRAKMYKIDLVLELLNENIQEILNRISMDSMKAYFISQKKDSKGKRSLDHLDIMVQDNYKTIPIGMVSGGQETLVGLAVLLSVWKVASELSSKASNILFLDEVFGPISSGMVNVVFETIVDLAKKMGARSVYVISHRDLNEQLFDHVWDLELMNGITKLEIIS